MKNWECSLCGHEAMADRCPDFRWSDGHVCVMKEVIEEEEDIDPKAALQDYIEGWADQDKEKWTEGLNSLNQWVEKHGGLEKHTVMLLIELLFTRSATLSSPPARMACCNTLKLVHEKD